MILEEALRSLERQSLIRRLEAEEGIFEFAHADRRTAGAARAGLVAILGDLARTIHHPDLRRSLLGGRWAAYVGEAGGGDGGPAGEAR